MRLPSAWALSTALSDGLPTSMRSCPVPRRNCRSPGFIQQEGKPKPNAGKEEGRPGEGSLLGVTRLLKSGRLPAVSPLPAIKSTPPSVAVDHESPPGVRRRICAASLLSGAIRSKQPYGSHRETSWGLGNEVLDEKAGRRDSGGSG